MILISDEDFMSEQQKNLETLIPLINKMESVEILAVDYGTIGRYLATYISSALIGERDYESYLYYTNKLIGDKEKAEFFLEPHTKKEIVTFIRENF